MWYVSEIVCEDKHSREVRQSKYEILAQYLKNKLCLHTIYVKSLFLIVRLHNLIAKICLTKMPVSKQVPHTRYKSKRWARVLNLPILNTKQITNQLNQKFILLDFIFMLHCKIKEKIDVHIQWNLFKKTPLKTRF
jgi:hypothetical protein